MAAHTEAASVLLANIEGKMDQSISASVTSHTQDGGSHTEITDLKTRVAQVEALCATLHTEYAKLAIRVTQLEGTKTAAQDTLAQGIEIDDQVNIATAQATQLETKRTTALDDIYPSVETDAASVSATKATQLEGQNAATLCDVSHTVEIGGSVSSSTTQVAEPEHKDIAALGAVYQETEIDDEANVASRQSTPLSWLSQTPTYDLDFGDSQFNYKHLLEPGSDDELPPTKRLRTESDGEAQNFEREEIDEDGNVSPGADLASGQSFEAATEVGLHASETSVGTIAVSGDKYGMPADPTIIAPSPLRPEVWSNKRGGLCEALDYYNAYKGSIYTSGRIVRGVLLDGEADPLDVFSAQVMIASM
jgi:hypothetical protein